jgi:hypothetical protein
MMAMRTPGDVNAKSAHRDDEQQVTKMDVHD